MYWYNPTTRTSERRTVPATDREAIEMLAGDPQFVSEYARLRSSGMEIEQSLILVGHELRSRQTEQTIPRSHQRRSTGYERLLGAVPSGRR